MTIRENYFEGYFIK